jgi:hypothetical protein
MGTTTLTISEDNKKLLQVCRLQSESEKGKNTESLIDAGGRKISRMI